MRILIVANDASPTDDPGFIGLAPRVERLLIDYVPGVCVGVAYPGRDAEPSSASLGGRGPVPCVEHLVSASTRYYPLPVEWNTDSGRAAWSESKHHLLAAIQDFMPDVIYCLGVEWPYSAVVHDVEVPVVVHMMGFLNLYFPACDMVLGYSASQRAMMQRRTTWGPLDHLVRKARAVLVRRLGGPARESNALPIARPVRTLDAVCAFECERMRANRYFMGRTAWDRTIVAHYSPGSRYYDVPEVLRPEFYAAAGTWKPHLRYDGTVRLLTVSSGDYRKGNGIILQAAELLRDLLGLRVEWHVTGHPELFPYFEERAGVRHEELGIELLGMIDPSRVVDELQWADFFVHPSIIDNSPNAVCEAQLVGCPVIASHVGGVASLVEDGTTGWLYPYDEPHALAFLVADLCEDERCVQEVSERAVRVASCRHDRAHVAQLLMEALEGIVACHDLRASAP